MIGGKLHEEFIVTMTDYIAEIAEGFRNLNAGDEFKREALRNIRKWLHDNEFELYREQIIDLVKKREFELLLDSFYQGQEENRKRQWKKLKNMKGVSNWFAEPWRHCVMWA